MLGDGVETVAFIGSEENIGSVASMRATMFGLEVCEDADSPVYEDGRGSLNNDVVWRGGKLIVCEDILTSLSFRPLSRSTSIC